MISPLNLNRPDAINIFVRITYPEKNRRRFRDHSRQLRSPDPIIADIVAERSTKIKTFKGFSDMESKLYVNRPNRVANPINNSTKAINLIIIFLPDISSSISYNQKKYAKIA